MKTSALACYLEAIANGLRASKSTDVPHIKWTSFKGPTVLHVGTVNIPVPPHADCKDLACIFPGLASVVSADVHGAKVEARNAQADTHEELIRAQADTIEHQAKVVESLQSKLAQAHVELKAADQTLLRMRHAPHAIEPARAHVVSVRPVAPAIAPQVDLINAILSDYSPKEAGPVFETIQPARFPSSGIAPQSTAQDKPALVLCFPLNGQGKTLAKAAVTLEEVKALYAFKFNDPKDATRGGYWLAKDPTGPKAQELARTLAKEGASVGTRIPDHIWA